MVIGINSVSTNNRLLTNVFIEKGKNKSKYSKNIKDNNYEKMLSEKEIAEEERKKCSLEKDTDKVPVQEYETQTETFVNPKGERILAIKMPFGVRYMKIGEVTNFLLSDNKSSNIESVLESNLSAENSNTSKS